ncbi:hypothetical protein AN958_10410 [Leucoagaricus sp. SymC.cos]|nr:hypothetical protein AN958_10410 [Leucoagaricus sp. SymC.cos]
MESLWVYVCGYVCMYVCMYARKCNTMYFRHFARRGHHMFMNAEQIKEIERGESRKKENKIVHTHRDQRVNSELHSPPPNKK